MNARMRRSASMQRKIQARRAFAATDHEPLTLAVRGTITTARGRRRDGGLLLRLFSA
jgi:hypothetical protein